MNLKKSKLFVFALLLSTFVLLQSCDYPIRGYFSSLRATPYDEYSAVVENPAYSTPLQIEGIKIFKQDVSCGYAVLQMLGQWSGKDITEQKLYEMNNNSVTTSMGNGFLKEISTQFPEWNIVRHVNCSNSDLLTKAYKSLEGGFPVPFEWAAKDDSGKWTLHFSLLTGIDFPNNKITVANPYGHEDVLTVDDFIKATRYESYEKMEWYFETGFNIELFNQNTIYIISKK